MIDAIAAILDRRAFLLYPWENPESEHFGKDYVSRCCSPGAIRKRRRVAREKAEKIMELFKQSEGEKL